jgi:hypothetical protein
MHSGTAASSARHSGQHTPPSSCSFAVPSGVADRSPPSPASGAAATFAPGAASGAGLGVSPASGGPGTASRKRSPGASRRDTGGGMVPHHARRALLSQPPPSPARVLDCALSTRGRRPGRGPPAAGMPGMTLKIRRGTAFQVAARQPLGGAVGAPMVQIEESAAPRVMTRDCPAPKYTFFRSPNVSHTRPSTPAFLNAVQSKC